MNIFKKEKEDCICNKYGINIMSFNILAPELLLEFWEKSYKLKNEKKSKLIKILKNKNKNIVNLLKRLKNDILCLQEVTINVKDEEYYLNGENFLEIEKLREEYINQYKIDLYEIANYSFKNKPIYYDFPGTYTSFKDKRFKCDSGIATLYNTKILEYIGGFKSEDFDIDDEPYEMIINKPKIKINESVEEFNRRVKKYKSNMKCSFKKSERCREKTIENGSPFTVDKFKIISTGEEFFVINTHIVMNYPRIDSMKRMISKINKYKLNNKNSSLMSNFTWTQTLFLGDMNGDTPESNKTININMSRTRMKSLFKSDSPDRFFVGNKIEVKMKKIIDVPLLKTNYLINDENDIIENQHIVDNSNITSDHNPLQVYFFKKN